MQQHLLPRLRAGLAPADLAALAAPPRSDARPFAEPHSSTRHSPPSHGARAAWLAARWPRVAIGDLQFRPRHVDGADGIDAAASLHAVAYVTLGDVLPADVHVALVASSPIGAPEPREARPRTMFSEASLHNGRFAFATDVPADEARGWRRWCVRVVPRGAPAAAAPVPTVERRYARCVDGAAPHEVVP